MATPRVHEPWVWPELSGEYRLSTYDAMSTQGQRVLAALRKMIVAGDLRPGERVAEIPLAEQLGVSRMPVRKAGARGYMVREISAQEMANAIEVRGVLEGLAARLVAERGLSRQARAALLNCLAEGDELFAKKSITDVRGRGLSRPQYALS